MRNPQNGFTLVEVLIAAFLLLLILMTLTQFLVSGNRSYQENTKTTGIEDELDLIAQLLNYDFRMAGHQEHGTLSETQAIPTCDPPDTNATVTASYWENRYAQHQQKTIHYAFSNGELTRTEEAATSHVLSNNIRSFGAHCDTPNLITFTLEHSAKDDLIVIAVPLIALSGGFL